MAPARSLLTIDGIEVEVRLKRMKTIRIHVEPPDGHVWVSAPLGTPRAKIEAVVRRHREFIREHKAKILATPPKPADDPLARGYHRLLGVDVPIVLEPSDGRHVRVRLDRDRLLVSDLAAGYPRQTQAMLDQIQWNALGRELTRLMPLWEARMGRSASWWGIRDMKTRWGSCSPQSGRIRFAFNLGSQHPREIEYIVVHELAHLFVPNHSPAFWSLVEQHLPTWRESHARLNTRNPNGPLDVD